MRAPLAALLALCCARLAGAALQYDYLNVYSCPPSTCLARKCVRPRPRRRRRGSRRARGTPCAAGGARITRRAAVDAPREPVRDATCHRCLRCRPLPLTWRPCAALNRSTPKGFAGPAVSFLECRPRGAVSGAATTLRPTVANAVYHPEALASTGSATAELCTPDALAAAAGEGGPPAALLVPFGAGGACAGAPRGAPLPLDGACRAAEPGAAKPFRRDTLRCVAGANATVRVSFHFLVSPSEKRAAACSADARAPCAQAEACDDAACSRGCQAAAPVAAAPNVCGSDGTLALCAALAPKAPPR